MDGIGDIIVGLDDDGDAGSAVSQGPYLVDMNTCFESFDIAQTYENGQDNPGVSSSARILTILMGIKISLWGTEMKMLGQETKNGPSFRRWYGLIWSSAYY